MAVKHVSVVLNAKAGALFDRADAGDKLRQALAEAGLEADFIPFDAGTLPERLAMAAASGADAVVVAGGDGTVACAGSALVDHDLPLGVLPFGTMNLLAKDLGLPIGDLAAAIQIIAGGKVRTIDVGDVNGKVFLCASMLGMPTHLGRTREETRGSALRLWWHMANAAGRLLHRARRLRVQLKVDGMPATVRAVSLSLTVGRLDEASGRNFGRTDLQSGQIGIYVIQRIGVRDVVRLAARMALGRWRQDSAVSERLAKQVEVSARNALHVMNDGELMLMQPPLRYRVRAAALRVLVP